MFQFEGNKIFSKALSHKIFRTYLIQIRIYLEITLVSQVFIEDFIEDFEFISRIDKVF